eukprot:jgi/Mesvir1/24362/Mv11035-RA.1
MSGPVVSPAWVAREPLQLEVRERIFSWSQDTFDVKDQYSRPVVKVKGKVLSLHEKKRFLDLDGNTILTMQAKLLTMHSTQEFLDNNNRLLFSVKQKRLIQFRNNVEIFLNDGDKDPDYTIRGDFLGKSYRIVSTKTKMEIAQIQRSVFGARNLLTGKDSYYVVVQPGTDLVFALGIAVAVDEIFHDKE